MSNESKINDPASDKACEFQAKMVKAERSSLFSLVLPDVRVEPIVISIINVLAVPSIVNIRKDELLAKQNPREIFSFHFLCERMCARVYNVRFYFFKPPNSLQ